MISNRHLLGNVDNLKREKKALVLKHLLGNELKNISTKKRSWESQFYMSAFKCTVSSKSIPVHPEPFHILSCYNKHLFIFNRHKLVFNIYKCFRCFYYTVAVYCWCSAEG